MPDPSSDSNESAKPPVVRLEVRNVCKRFPGVLALDQVDLQLNPGEVLAVIGENGAGKSTLMKILAGIQSADQGQILLDGQQVSLPTPRVAQNHGIALIHQELNLCDNLDVSSNIFLGREPSHFGFMVRDSTDQQTENLLDRVGLEVSPRKLVSQLSIGHQQLVEIAKALSINARILIMDEPTSSLTNTETAKLFEVIQQLRNEGVAVIYISHRLREVEEIADRVSVLRDGQNAGALSRSEINHEAMVNLMVGRDVSQFYARKQHETGEPVLQVDSLCTKAWPDEPNSFEIRRGEIVGLAGLVGAGRTELMNCLFGVDRMVAGNISVDGQSVRIASPSDAIETGLALVPEDRKQNGVLLDWTITQNISLPQLDTRFSTGPFIKRNGESTQAIAEIQRLGIRASGPGQLAGLLSGGNQQKVVIGKWLATNPKVLLMDEPTRGIDVGAKHEIYGLMEVLAQQGMAILFVSSEMEEIIGMSDRVMVMHEGQITGTLARGESTEEKIMHLATTHNVN